MLFYFTALILSFLFLSSSQIKTIEPMMMNYLTFPNFYGKKIYLFFLGLPHLPIVKFKSFLIGDIIKNAEKAYFQ